MGIYPNDIAMPNAFSICIDNTLNGDESGRLYHVFSKQPRYFNDAGQLIKMIDAFLDEINFPQATMIYRSFKSRKKKMEWEKKDMEVTNVRMSEQRGNKATFVVHILYRQNASWQGRVTWVENKQSVSFRSVLEFLKLIDSALDFNEEETDAKVQA